MVTMLDLFGSLDLNAAFSGVDLGVIVIQAIFGFFFWLILRANAAISTRYYLSLFALFSMTLFALAGGVSQHRSFDEAELAAMTVLLCANLFAFPAVFFTIFSTLLVPGNILLKLVIFLVAYSSILGVLAQTTFTDRKVLLAIIYGLPGFTILVLLARAISVAS